MKTNDNRIVIGCLIRTMRDAAGWNQQDLADLMGLTRTSVCNLESGRQGLSVDALLRLADCFGVTPSELLPGGIKERRTVERLTGLLKTQHSEIKRLESRIRAVKCALREVS
jgi:transcriptional regulator with XRE-family HTH domain